MNKRAIQRMKDEIAMFEMGMDILSQADNADLKLNQTVVQAMMENNQRLLRACEEGTPIIASYHAFALLYLLGEQSRLNTNAPWESGLELPLWAWILIGAAITVLAIFIIRRYYMY